MGLAALWQSRALTCEDAVVTAIKGQEALKYGLAGKVVDAVVTDLETLRLSGLRLIEGLHVQLPTTALPCKMSKRASEACAEHAAKPGTVFGAVLGTVLGADAYPTEPATTAPLPGFLTGARAR